MSTQKTIVVTVVVCHDSTGIKSSNQIRTGLRDKFSQITWKGVRQVRKEGEFGSNSRPKIEAMEI